MTLHRQNRLLKEAVQQSGHVREQWLASLRNLQRAREELREAHQKLDRTVEQLSVQNTRFEAALGNMTQGLCLLNAGHRIAVLNRRFGAMFGIADGNSLVDCPPEMLVEATIQAGICTAETAQDLFSFAQTGAGSKTSLTRQLLDGRTIAACFHPTEDGGWIATFEDITERRQAEARIDYMALHDALTTLPNRVLFRIHLDRELAGVKRGDHLAVLFLDLDRFKAVNDTLGHHAGDALLQAVAGQLKAAVRESDVVARLGGDEFAIIQTKTEQPTSARALARRLLDVLSDPYEVDGFQVVVGVSIGIALAPADGVAGEHLLKNADLALYRAKAEGRGTYRFFEPRMDAKMKERRLLELDLRHALANAELRLFFQPLIDVTTETVTGFEALLRWQHPTRGLVLPSEFIPVAEEAGLIVPIGEWVLENACREAATWPEAIELAINISAVQFRNPHLVEVVEQALRASGLSADRLSLEITESVLIQDTQATLTTLQRLRELGVRISMDDFGTGYSSLSYLRSFPFDKIKIDNCFMKDLGRSDSSTAIIRAIVHLGRALGMTVTAEGVETAEQLSQVRAEGCAEGQGFLFSRPCPADAVASTIEQINRSAQRPPTGAVRSLPPSPHREPSHP